MITLGSEQLLQIVLGIAAAAMAAVAAVFLLVVRGTRRRRGRGWVWGFAYFAAALAFNALTKRDPALEPVFAFIATACAAASAYFTAATAFELKGCKMPLWASALLILCDCAALALISLSDPGADMVASEVALLAGMAIFAVALLPVVADARRSAVRVICAISLILSVFLFRTVASSAILALSGRELNAVYWTWEVVLGVLIAFVLAMGELVALLDEIRLEMEEANTALNAALQGLEIAAKLDPLTGLFNRYAFYTLVAQLREQRRLEGSIVILDLNNLKTINDTFGHDAGDRALLSVARSLRGVLPNPDHIFRWGGDEFVLLMPGTAPETARVRLAAMEPPEPLEVAGTAVRVELALSWGVAPVSSDIDSSLGDADAKLYSQKRLGKQLRTVPEA